MICFHFSAQDLFQYHRSEMFLICTVEKLFIIVSKKNRPVPTSDILDIFLMKVVY